MYNAKSEIDKLAEELISVNYFESNNTVCTNVKIGTIIKSIIKKTTFAAKLEWDHEIIRDEALATFYEALLICCESDSYEEISLNNDKLIGSAFNYTLQKNKKYLLSDKIDNKINTESILGLNYNSNNKFITWFNNNKNLFLTQKQLDFLDNKIIYEDSEQNRKMRRRIEERILKNYNSLHKNKNIDILNQIKIIENLLKSNNFFEDIKEYSNSNLFNDIWTDYLSIEARQNYQASNYTTDTLKDFRIALFKKLNELNKKI